MANERDGVEGDSAPCGPESREKQTFDLRDDDLLEEALEETFPASDPAAANRFG